MEEKIVWVSTLEGTPRKPDQYLVKVTQIEDGKFVTRVDINRWGDRGEWVFGSGKYIIDFFAEMPKGPNN